MVLRRFSCFRRLPFAMTRKGILRLAIPFTFLACCLFIAVKLHKYVGDLGYTHTAMVPPDIDLRWTLIKSRGNASRSALDAEREARLARQRFASMGIALVDRTRHVVPLNLKTFDTVFPHGNQYVLSGDNRLHPNSSKSMSSNPSLSYQAGHKHTLSSTLKTKTSHLENSTIEPPPDTNLLLVILVVSKPNNVLLRQATRKTWGLDVDPFRTSIRFVVGRREGWNDIIDRESEMHGDLIISEADDEYEVLTNKVIEGIMWVLRQKRPTSFLMKIDDDTIVNVPQLVKELLNLPKNTTQIIGAICTNTTVIRDPEDKWSISMLDYPYAAYPPFAFGGGYVMSVKTASMLMEVKTFSSDWIHVEDVYITGILALKAGIGHMDNIAFASPTNTHASACEFVQSKRITSVNNTEREIFNMYTDIQALVRNGQTSDCS